MSGKETSAYLNLGRDKLLSQENLHREFSDKVLKIAGYSGLTIGFGLTILKIGDSCIIEPYLFIGQVLMFIIIVSIAMIIVHPSKWHTSPDMKNVAAILSDYPPEKIIEAMGDTYSKAIASNQESLGQKAALLKYASWATLVQILLLASMAIFSVL